MADYDRRRRGGGGFNNRKRRYQDDDYGNEENQRYKSRRREDPPATILRRQVITLGEELHRRVEDDIASSAKLIVDNYFDSDLTGAFLDLVISLTLEQPMKIPFVASIVLITNTQKPEFTEEVLKKLGDELQAKITSGQWRDVKLLMRFLACLQGLFQGDGIFPLLDELFTRAGDLQSASSEDMLGLELTKIILFTVAYTMASSAQDISDQANTLLEQTAILAESEHILENLVDPFPSSELGAPVSHRNTVALMQEQMQEEARNGWPLSCLSRPWKVQRSSEEEELFTNAQKHQFPGVELPSVLPVGDRQLFPEIYFSVYDTQDIATVPPAKDPGALLIRDALSDTINAMHFNRMISAKALIDLDMYFAPDTFVKRATAFDKLRDVAGEKNTWKPEDVIVDATFAQMMQLPMPEHKLIYYHSVLTEACKAAPAAVAPSLGRAIRYLFRNVDKMDVELNHRFLDWFAHHLSNFGFTWKWTEWVEEVNLPDVHPKKAFIIDALDKEIRLSFAKRIKGTLPEVHQELIPAEKERDTPVFKFSDKTHALHVPITALLSNVRERANEGTVEGTLELIESTAARTSDANPKLTAIDVYITVIVHVGSKSLSHALAVIERSRPVLTSRTRDDKAARKQVISSVMDFWQYQPGVAVFLIDKLVNYGLVQNLDVIEWALIDRIDRGTILSKGWCYELIDQAMEKAARRCKQAVARVRYPALSNVERADVQVDLDKDLISMREIFTAIEDAVSSVASASEDGMIESSDQLRAEEEPLLQAWGAKWVRFVRRRSAVEENWVKEELAKPLPELDPLPESKDEAMQEEQIANGHAAQGDEHDLPLPLRQATRTAKLASATTRDQRSDSSSRSHLKPIYLFSALILLIGLALVPYLRSPPPQRTSKVYLVKPSLDPFGDSIYRQEAYYDELEPGTECKPKSVFTQELAITPRILDMALEAEAKRMVKEFEYTTEDLNNGVNKFMQEMGEGLAASGTHLSQIPTYVTAVPNGTEKGTFLAVDLGGTNFRVCSIKLHGNQTFSLTQSKVAVPRSMMETQDVRELFGFLAKQIETFLKTHHEDHFMAHRNKPKSVDYFDLGFTFSFPVEQVGINKGRLVRWTKGFNVKEAIGQDVCALLQREIDALDLPVTVAALVNDTVGALMARSYTSPGKLPTLIGAIFGTGTNGAYIEQLSRIKKLADIDAKEGKNYDDTTGLMLINTEWGSFDNALNVLPKTPYDDSLDRESNNPGVQMFEKRVSGMFLGEILRRALLALAQSKEVAFFRDDNSSTNDSSGTTVIDDDSALYKQWGIDTSFLSIVEEDQSDHLRVTKQVLERQLGVYAASTEDAIAVKMLVHAIGKRAARLAAVALGAVVVESGKLKTDEYVDIGVDGSLVEYYPGFEDYIREAFREIEGIGEDEKKIRIGLAKDGSGLGAALIALVAHNAMKAGKV